MSKSLEAGKLILAQKVRRRSLDLLRKMSGTGATTNAADMAEAARIRHGAGGSSSSKSSGRDLPRRVIVDEGGVQKYVLVQAKLDPPVYFVRGDATASYHKNAAYPLIKELSEASIPYEVVGGGRIRHDAKKKEILVYGFSYGFPWANGISKHDVAAELLKVEYPDYKIETSDEGY